LHETPICVFGNGALTTGSPKANIGKHLIGSMRHLSKSPQRFASYFDHPAVAYAKAD
jgi:hypothetical protein